MSINTKVQSSRRRVERGIYEQPNGKYMVCFMVSGKPRFRVVGLDLDEARGQREVLIEAAKRGDVPVATSLRLSSVVDRWLVRYETLVAADLRRSRTLEAHRYYLDGHMLPRLGRRRVSAITVDDVCDVIAGMRVGGCSEKTIGNALATLHSVLRFAMRHGWIVDDPIGKLEADERPHPQPRRQRVLGRDEVVRLLACTTDAYKPLVATALFTGMRISELLGLLWEDVDLGAGTIHVRAQLSRAHRGAPAARVAPKTRAAVREIPLVPQLADVLRVHRALAPDVAVSDWVFPSQAGTPLGHRNAQRRALARAAKRAGLEGGDWPPLRFHDLRHTFASHLIIDLGLDVAQVSRILGHAQITTTLSVYTHLFDDARHAQDLKARMAASAFAALLEPTSDRQSGGTLVPLPERAARRRLSAREASDAAVGHLTAT